MITLGTTYFFTRFELSFSSPEGVVIYTGFVMMAFATLFLEHFFTKPSDVLATSISILLILLPMQSEISEKLGIWYKLFIFYNFVLVALAFTSLYILDPNKSENEQINKASNTLKIICTYFGKAKFLYLGLSAMMIFNYVDHQKPIFVSLFMFGLILVAVEPNKVYWKLIKAKKAKDKSLGDVRACLSERLYEIKFDKDVYPKLLDSFFFRYSVEKSVIEGVLVEISNTHEGIVGKLLVKGYVERSGFKVTQNKIYKSEAGAEEDLVVGIVSTGSDIGKIKFEPISGVELNEGDLVKVKCRDVDVLYQIVNSVVIKEVVDGHDERQKTIAECIQVGTWDNGNKSFDKYGWVPDLYSSVLMAGKGNSTSEDVENYYKIGTIPNTDFPVLLNKEYCITHHTAILGVTGVGKSVFTRNLISNLVSSETKFICIDFTGEYKNKFNSLGPTEVVSLADQKTVYEKISVIFTEFAKFENNRNQTVIKDAEKAIEGIFDLAITNYLQGSGSLSILELPDLSNTSEIFDYTRRFFRSLFKIAKSNKSFGKKVCVVLEEAHTVIPEWNSSGASERNAQQLVNSIAQIALQGRKYNIGFFVIAQRTANVSKTILTQCNSIIAFKQFDKTSSEFLVSFIGSELISALPRLKNRQAIAVGKAFKANVPMIFEVPIINEHNSNLTTSQGSEQNEKVDLSLIEQLF